MTRMLASVTSLAEARIVIDAGADLVDLKDPHQGALGALPVDIIRDVVRQVGEGCLTSATAGDLPMEPATVSAAAAALAETGVDYVKVGLFPGAGRRACISGLGKITANGTRLVVVMFADCEPDFSLIDHIKENGSAGVMLDTATKTGGGLRDVMHHSELHEFVERARDAGLMVGLAGSLRIGDITALLDLEPDYLGFRGALCAGTERTQAIDPSAVGKVRSRIPCEASTVLRHAG